MAQIFHVKETDRLLINEPKQISGLIEYQVELDTLPEMIPYKDLYDLSKEGSLPERIIIYAPERNKAFFLFRSWLEDPDKYLFSGKIRAQPSKKVKSSQLSKIGPIVKKNKV